MEEEPKKGSQNQPISEIDESSKTSQVSSALDESNGSGKFTESKKSKPPVEDKSINKNPQRRFRDFLTRGDIDSSESSPSISNNAFKGSEEKSKEDKKGDDEGSPESHDFHFSQELMKFNFYKKLRSNKEQVLRISGGIIGVLFIIAGILYVIGSPVRVADNVVSGERAVISAFLVLVGVLIIAGSFARRILEVSFLKNIHSELEVAEDQNSEDSKDKEGNQKVNSKENSKDEKGKQKGNIEEKDKK